MSQTLGRRERKKRETRRALADAALGLFAERGFDGVTITEIADAADVDPSTFFRHFPAKEAVLFADVDILQEYITYALLARPKDEPLLVAATQALQAAFARLQRSPEQEQVRQSLMDATPAVRAWMADMLTQSVETLGACIAVRMNVDPVEDPRPHLVAALVVHGGDWVRRNRLAHGRSLDDKSLVGELPKIMKRLLPVLERKV